jgi:hypothetical protein
MAAAPRLGFNQRTGNGAARSNVVKNAVTMQATPTMVRKRIARLASQHSGQCEGQCPPSD